MSMLAERYTVEHQTRYIYTAPVSQSWQLARLTPRMLPWQKLLSHSVHIEPPPDERRDELDSFGNMVTHFGLHGAHRALSVRMTCLVEVSERPPAPAAEAPPMQVPLQVQTQGQGQMQMQMQTLTLTQAQAQAQTQAQMQVQTSAAVPPVASWESVRDAIRHQPQLDDLVPAGMSEPTLLVPLSDAARAYALPSFARGRPWLEAVADLMHRIHADFEFQPGATTVSTSVDEVMYQRSGVCQDFAHLMLACLRSVSLPARYVSGYLLTDPPLGMPRLMGVDASHAWVAAYAPNAGWVEFDPTNDQLADQRYITLAWGADFADVVPLRGVILGGGEQRMDVEVSVFPS